MIAVLLGLGIVAVSWVVVAVQTTVTARAGESLLYLLRVRSYAHLQRLGLDYYERELSGRIMTRMTTDVDALSSFLQTGLAQAVVSLLTVGGVTVALMVTDPELALVALAALPILVAATLRFRVLSSGRTRKRASRSRSSTPTCRRTSPACGSRRRSPARAPAGGVRRPQPRVPRDPGCGPSATSRPSSRSSRCCSDLATAAVLGVGAARVASGTLTPACSPRSCSTWGCSSRRPAALPGLRRLPAGPHRPAAHRRPAAHADLGPARGDPIALPEQLSGEVSCATSTSPTRAPSPALDKLSLDVAPGETVALVGATGAGKSTPVKLVARFYDATGGAVLIDGVDVREYDLAGLAHRLGVVPQEAHLFTGNVAETSATAAPTRPTPRSRRPSRSVGALDGVAALPAGFLHARRRTRPVAVRGPAPARRARPRRAREPRRPAARRGHRRPRPVHRGRGPARRTAYARPARRTTFVVAHRLATAAKADRIVVLHAAASSSRVRLPNCSRGTGGSPGCGGPASWSPPQTRRMATSMISTE